MNPLNYEGSIWRPPSEARSLILQATVGCSHNACTFCISYKKKKYRVRGADGIQSDLNSLPKSIKNNTRRVFLADGNALAMSTEEMQDVLRVLNRELPALERVGTYGYAKDVRDKSVEELKTLWEAGLGIMYLGLETGEERLLRWVRKGVTTEENVEASLKIRRAGISLSITIILGLGGKERSEQHAVATAEALNRIDPEYVGALTLMIPPGTQLYEIVQHGDFQPMKPFDILRELRILIEHVNLSECIFRTNHASNYLPLRGTLSRDKPRLLEVLDSAIESKDEQILRPGYARGL
jgi:radical SAM superfamily enzyme YgiQ (UPF0313 family)